MYKVKQLNRFKRLNLSNLVAMLTLCIGCLGCTATATDTKPITARSILEKLGNQEPVFIENKTIEGDLDFTTLATYPQTETIRSVAIESSVYFKNCVFTGKVTAFNQRNGQTILCDFGKNLTFLNSKFNGETSFQSISVRGISSFANSQFNRNVTFEGARFGSETYFDGAMFTREVRFQTAHFAKMASFWKTIWAGVVYFQSAVFAGDARFNLGDFRSNLDFSMCTTDGQLTFNYAQSTGRNIFDNCRFRNAVDFSNATLKEASFKEAFFDTKATFIGVKSESLSFENAFFLSQKPLLDSAGSTPNVTGARLATSAIIPAKR
ncbi:pentapeptide repeat-containing protein [Spirosoma sp. BT702]|uniref:Pentapeptide repeat-containing protein n=1 Tax=Spirosoma profusum TaxID=2771354 RepID=A0A927ANE8_9BACT|nr:pentapeptide repeat-containing protein [Spirosoma profusum]MBD2701714.1 pentapeptide repeat-containing protein [Spirosoma profusum]